MTCELSLRLFLTVKNTFSLSYRWLLSSSLFPLRLLHHQSVWWNPLLTRSSLSFFKVAPKNGFHLIFLGLGLAFYQLAMTASAGRVIFNRDRTDWALFSGNCRNISGKCRRPKNLITLHHETDHGKHWTPPRLICCCRSVRDWIFPLTFSELSTTPDLRLQGHQFQRAHIKTLEFKRVSSGHLINALSFCWKSVGTRLS